MFFQRSRSARKFRKFLACLFKMIDRTDYVVTMRMMRLIYVYPSRISARRFACESVSLLDICGRSSLFHSHVFIAVWRVTVCDNSSQCNDLSHFMFCDNGGMNFKLVGFPYF